MPRAFLITNKRYNSSVDHEDTDQPQRPVPPREYSPERRVSTAEVPAEHDTANSRSSSGGDASASCWLAWKPASPRSPASLTRTTTPVIEEPLSLTVHDVAQLQPPTSAAAAAASVSILAAVLQQVRTLQQDVAPPSAMRTTLSNGDAYYVCPECGKRYSTSSNLARHRQTHRSVTDKKARQCPHCSKVYVSMPAFSMHVRTHGQGCQCPFCGKCFSRPWLLQGHIRTHTGEKPFKCSQCSKAFADKSNLRAHIQTHSPTKPFVCRRCGKAFALKSYLYKHEESSCMRIHRLQEPDAQSPTGEDVSVPNAVPDLLDTV
ncbi:zinc finger protein SNAI2 [Ixodes scapularis]|uniref:zinc finger protein SNAI2 n=1 Tax=Ixodes scapularis TaxID=6945 RepID=UPI0011615D04|nr:zinc finger protein SNAI2 [Ixodes scapularis]